MSPSLPNRNVPFWGRGVGGRVRVNSSARGRAQADAQGRCDGAGSEESARPLRSNQVRRGFCLLAFFGEAPERRPWARKRERPPGRFCPAFLIDCFAAGAGTGANYQGSMGIPKGKET